MREIVLDTETTGLDPASGHRVVEIGCVEIVNLIPTGRTFWTYINPERDVPADAAAVHGITTEFLKDKPVFAQVVGSFMEFVSGARLVIHNAEFDIKFLNAELRPCGFPMFSLSEVIDTLAVARRRFPGAPASLDALCKRFSIDNSDRSFHGALKDARLLADVYLELMGGRQQGFSLDMSASPAAGASSVAGMVASAPRRERAPRSFALAEDEAAAHEKLLDSLKNPLWRQQGGT